MAPLKSLPKAGQGACLHAEVPDQSIWQVRVSARRRGNLIEKDEIASVPSQ
jgi:hypothetical protein